MTKSTWTFTERERRAILTALYTLLQDARTCESLNEGGMDEFSSADLTLAIEKLEETVRQTPSSSGD
jgi:hypothetical protein